MTAQTNITLAGKKYILRPDFSDLNQIERRLGNSLTAIARKLSEGEMRLDELAIIIEHSLKGECPDEIKSALMETGVFSALEAVARMMVTVLGNGEAKTEKITRTQLDALMHQFPDITRTENSRSAP